MTKAIEKMTIDSRYDELCSMFMQEMEIEDLREVAARMVDCSSSRNYLIAVINAGRMQDKVWQIFSLEDKVKSSIKYTTASGDSSVSSSTSSPSALSRLKRRADRTQSGRITKGTRSSRSRSTRSLSEEPAPVRQESLP